MGRELGEAEVCRVSHRGGEEVGWLGLGVRGQVWLLRLQYRVSGGEAALAGVERTACLDCRTPRWGLAATTARDLVASGKM